MNPVATQRPPMRKLLATVARASLRGAPTGVAPAMTRGAARLATRATARIGSATTDDKAKAVEAVVKDINARFGKGSIMFLNSEPEKMETISTGALTLDVALGGGLPKGRIVEIFGPESSGKTTVALHAIASVQAAGGRAALIDAEHAFDPTYAAAIGIDLAALLVSQPDCGETALEMVDALIRSDAMDVVVVDSVAALTPRAELEGEIGQATIGLQARLMSSAMRKVAANASRANTTVLMINQLRMKVGVLYGNPEVTPGGNALKFYASARIDVRRKAAIEGPGGSANNVGIRVRAKVVKNKCAPPYRQAEFDILFANGISGLGCVLDAAEAAGAVERRGAWFYFGDVRLGQGKEKSVAALEADPELRGRVEAAARAALGQVVAAVPGGAIVPAVAPLADAVASTDDADKTEAA